MPRLRCFLVLALGLLLLSGVPANATPRLTLRLERATFHEALQQLKQVSGWDIRGPSGEGSEFYEEAPNPTRSSFDWREASLGKVCRDLGEAFRCVARYAGTNTLRFDARAPAPPGVRPVAAVTRSAITLLAEQVEVVRLLNLESAPPKPAQECRVRLALRPADGDPSRFYGLNQVRGVDNLGRTFTWDRTELLRPGPLTESRPDEWAVDATLKGLDSRATRLSWLEGELLLYREVRRQRIDVPISGTTLPYTNTEGTVELVLSELRQSAPGSVQVRVEESWPDAAEVSTTSHNNPNWPYPAVRLASGRLARMGGSASASLEGGRRRVTITCAYEGNPADPPVSVVWDPLIKSQPDERLTLRLENIPLGTPPAGFAVSGTGRPGAARPAASPPPAGPGSLANRVLLDGQPGGEGELAIGLSMKKRDGTWDAIRWQVLDTDLTGAATLDEIAPGTYRVLRKFRPTERPTEPAGSFRWENDNVTIRVEPGKQVTLPPLSRVKK